MEQGLANLLSFLESQDSGFRIQVKYNPELSSSEVARAENLPALLYGMGVISAGFQPSHYSRGILS
jgi:hypothetical protein